MLVILSVVSIWVIALCAWLVNRVLPFRVCPICVGVSGTWIMLLATFFLGYPVDLMVPALLMGGSVVGMAYSLEKKLPATGKRTPLLFKALFIPVGFVAAYSILAQWWTAFLVSFVFLLCAVFVFLYSGTKQSRIAEELEEKMKHCC